MMTRHDRLIRLAKALHLTPTENIRLSRPSPLLGERWWLCGCVEGDQPLPMTRPARTEADALRYAEDWLAPEVDKTEILEDD